MVEPPGAELGERPGQVLRSRRKAVARASYEVAMPASFDLQLVGERLCFGLAAGLKAVRLAELLDVTPMQVSRWENGRKPLERRAVALVSALALEQVEGKAATRTVLEALAAGKKPPRNVRLNLNAAG
jgi:hypothetical protein